MDSYTISFKEEVFIEGLVYSLRVVQKVMELPEFIKVAVVVDNIPCHSQVGVMIPGMDELADVTIVRAAPYSCHIYNTIGRLLRISTSGNLRSTLWILRRTG